MSEDWTARCRECSAESYFGLAGMDAALRDLGFLKREGHPDPQLVFELFEAQQARVGCPECGAATLEFRPGSEEGWMEARTCEICGGIIAPERLEIFPNAVRCAQCQQSQDTGDESDPPEFCARCGALMKIQLSSSGVSRYRMKCSECGAVG